MQDQPIHGRPDSGGSSPTEAEDVRDQGIVLIHVLTRHPVLLMVPELVREITSGSDEFEEGDRIERAVRDLTGYGLLHCPRGIVMPTPAAQQFLKVLYEGNC